MDFTDPFVGMSRPKLTDEELATAIRIDMASELDAISLYEAHYEATDNPVAKRMLRHIIDEEKGHLEEFAQILYYIDPVQAEKVGHARVEFEEEGGVPADICSTPEEGIADEAPVVASPTLTVGSLKESMS